MEIRYNKETFEVNSYSHFVKMLTYWAKWGKDDEKKEYTDISFLDKLKYKYYIYKASKEYWETPLSFKNIFLNNNFVRDMYNCGQLDINDNDGFGWYSEYFKDEKIIP